MPTHNHRKIGSKQEASNLPGRWDREDKKEVQSCLQNPAGMSLSLYKKSSLVQVLSTQLTEGLVGSLGTFRNTSMPREPTVRLAQMANLQPKDPGGFVTFQHLMQIALSLLSPLVAHSS